MTRPKLDQLNQVDKRRLKRINGTVVFIRLFRMTTVFVSMTNGPSRSAHGTWAFYFWNHHHSVWVCVWWWVSALVLGLGLVLKYVIKPVPSLFLLFPVGVVAAVGVVVGTDAASAQLVQLGPVAMAAVDDAADAATTDAATASLQTYILKAPQKEKPISSCTDYYWPDIGARSKDSIERIFLRSMNRHTHTHTPGQTDRQTDGERGEKQMT